MPKPLLAKFVFAVILAIVIWAGGLALFVASIPSIPDNNNEETTDGIVIFTGGSMRLETGLGLLNSGKAQKMLVSGVGERTGLDSMLMLSGKLPDNILEIKDKIDLGYEARNTRGNAVEVKKWVQDNNYKSIRLVTANYHIPRSYLELSNAMPDVVIIKNPVFPGDIKLEKWWRDGLTKKILISEYNKYIASRVMAMVGR